MSATARGNHTTPNVYSQEIQVQTYSPKSIGATTLGLVGETQIGPAFQPIPISSYKEFVNYFGGTSPEKFDNLYPKYELPYIAKSYLEQSQQLYVTRVLGLSGYDAGNAFEIMSGGKHVATLRSNAKYDDNGVLEYNIPQEDEAITGDDISVDNNKNFTLTINEVSYSLSLNKSKPNYIGKVFSRGYNKNADMYLEELHENVLDEVGNTIKLNTVVDDSKNFQTEFKSAVTPWFVSENKGGKVAPLFRFYTISDGESANRMIKVSIRNVDVAKLTFDVQVRAIYDTDLRPVILESFTNCSLNPNSGTAYLGNKVGTIDDQYAQKSKYVVLDIIDDDIVNNSVPMGFAGYPARYATTTPTYYSEFKNTGAVNDKKFYFGITDTNYDLYQFKGTNIKTRTNGFHLDETVGVNENGEGGVEFTDGESTCKFVGASGHDNTKRLMKFTAYFYGGFDGWDIFNGNRTNTNEYNAYDTTQGVQRGVEIKDGGGSVFESTFGIPNVPSLKAYKNDYYAYWSAIRTFADSETIDINLIATPGIDLINNSMLINETIEMVENERRDCLYIATLPDKDNNGDSTHSRADMLPINQIVDSVDNFDSNYVATYYPWCQYYDSENNAYIYLPPTKDVLRNMAYTDNAAYSWFPPAGINRGNVNCVKAKKNVLIDESDEIYANRINVIKTFAQDGVKIWGQKTLQKEDTPLNRIGVRRMMLYIRKTVRNSNLPLIFEPNDETTKTRFLEIVNPILNGIKNNRGIQEFKVIIDSSIEAKLRHEMNVQIWIKPIGALEYINIDFMITDEGFDFGEV